MQANLSSIPEDCLEQIPEHTIRSKPQAKQMWLPNQKKKKKKKTTKLKIKRL